MHRAIVQEKKKHVPNFGDDGIVQYSQKTWRLAIAHLLMGPQKECRGNQQ
jgi:hypothetical protein